MASKSRKRRKQRQRAKAAAGEDGSARLAEASPASPKPAARSRAVPADRDELPPPPWGNFPLVELWILAGLILIVVGFILLVAGSDAGTALLLGGLALGSIGGLETSIREHLAGYRSHTAVLAGVPALAVVAILFFAGPAGMPSWTRALIALAVFGVAAWLLTILFSRRSGGLRFRLSPLPGRRRR